MGLITLLYNNPGAFILLVIPLLYSIIIHELAHGWVADKMGDSTARWLGRLSLDPRKHLDPIGTAMLFIFGFGWAKPVPVNFNNLRDQRKGMILVSAAGIVANISLAFISLFFFQPVNPAPFGAFAIFLIYMAQINIMLAAFNLIPHSPAGRFQNFDGVFFPAVSIYLGPNLSLTVFSSLSPCLTPRPEFLQSPCIGFFEVNHKIGMIRIFLP